MTSPHTAGRAESLAQHYREVRARLYGPTPRAILLHRPAPPAIEAAPKEVERVKPRARDFIFIKPRAAGTIDKSSRGGTWNAIAAEMIVAETADMHGVTTAQIKGYSRAKPVVVARFATFYRLQRELGYSLPMIGQTVGGRDHSGVLHGIRRHEATLRGAVFRRPLYGKALEAAGL